MIEQRPGTTAEEDSKTKKKALTVHLTTAITVGALAGIWGVWAKEVVEDLTEKYLGTDERYEAVKREKGVEGLDSYYESLFNNLDKNQIKDLIIGRWRLARESFVNLASYELITDYSDDTEEFIKKQRYETVVDGAQILKNFYHYDIDIDQDNYLLKLKGVRDLDISSSRDLILADSLISSHADLESNEAAGTLNSYENFKIQKEIEDLKWLANSNLNIEIRERTFAFPEKNVLINMSRFYQFIEEYGYTKPEKIVFKPYTANGRETGFYFDKEIYLTNESPIGVAVHEGAHNQAYENDLYNQEKFNKVVNETRKSVEQRIGQSLDISKTYITDYASTRSGEDYAETLENYFVSGVDFRYKLKELMGRNTPEHEILLAKYNFAKDFFHGKEFIRNGELFEPKRGDVFEISDPDGEKRGISIRKNEDFELVGGRSSVHNGDKVRIIGGPLEIFDEDEGKNKIIWKVQKGEHSGDSFFYSGEDVGWIWDYWLGNKTWDSGAGHLNGKGR